MKVAFIPTSITSVERQVTQELLLERERHSELDRFNYFLSELLSPRERQVYSPRFTYFASSLSNLLAFLLRNFLFSKLKDRNILICLENAYDFILLEPNLYAKINLNRSILNRPKRSEIINVHVHLRFANFAHGTERYLGPEYYYRTLDHLSQKLELGESPYLITIHSDFTSSLPESSDSGITPDTKEYLKQIGILDSGHNVNSEIYVNANKCKNAIKIRYRNVIENETQDPLSELIEMANADYLILSKSSFAFVAGVLNLNGTVFSPIYWNQPLRSWISEGVFEGLDGKR